MVQGKGLIIGLAILIGGCSTSSPMFEKLGTYTVEVTDEGAKVHASTIKGGPDVTWRKTEDGVELIVTPSKKMIIDALIDLAP